MTTALDGKMHWHGKEAHMSDTPRTDEAWDTVSRTPDGRYATDVPLRQLASVMCEHSKQLERELADMTKQRDHYKAACDQYSEDEMLCKLQEVTKQRDELRAERGKLRALVGTIRSQLNLTARNVSDITPEEHSHETGAAIDALRAEAFLRTVGKREISDD